MSTRVDAMSGGRLKVLPAGAVVGLEVDAVNAGIVNGSLPGPLLVGSIPPACCSQPHEVRSQRLHVHARGAGPLRLVAAV
jgi:hypothetical protein